MLDIVSRDKKTVFKQLLETFPAKGDNGLILHSPWLSAVPFVEVCKLSILNLNKSPCPIHRWLAAGYLIAGNSKYF